MWSTTCSSTHAGENEGAICNKSCDNTYRFNTFAEGCTELSLRHGNRCQVYGNFFIGTTGGLRFFGDDHKIYSNYFERNRVAVQIGNGDGIVPPDKLTSHDRPDRVELAFNTLVDNRTNLSMGGRGRRGLGATELVVANNLIQGGAQAASIGGPLPKHAGRAILFGPPRAARETCPRRGSRTSTPNSKRATTGCFDSQMTAQPLARRLGRIRKWMSISTISRAGWGRTSAPISSRRSR